MVGLAVRMRVATERNDAACVRAGPMRTSGPGPDSRRVDMPDIQKKNACYDVGVCGAVRWLNHFDALARRPEMTYYYYYLLPPFLMN